MQYDKYFTHVSCFAVYFTRIFQIKEDRKTFHIALETV